ncbi:MAG: BON domain-containing protein [Bacteroidota bacterium]|nr:BON domain-containing protein [Bacteroidota bacterium]
MKSDAQIQKDVLEQLKWEPILIANEIGVSVKNGVVTLSGQVNSYTKKLAAERSVKRVVGVKALAEDIQIGVSPSYQKTDTEIAAAVLNALKWHTGVDEEKIKIKVEDGIVTLEGEVEWEYQKTSAESSIENLAGVRSVLNFVTIKPKLVPLDVKEKIKSSFQRHASIDARQIKVQVIGAKVILSGKVRSFAEKEDATDAAWLAPGVTAVENKIEIEEEEYAYYE